MDVIWMLLNVGHTDNYVILSIKMPYHLWPIWKRSQHNPIIYSFCLFALIYLHGCSHVSELLHLFFSMGAFPEDRGRSISKAKLSVKTKGNTEKSRCVKALIVFPAKYSLEIKG